MMIDEQESLRIKSIKLQHKSCLIRKLNSFRTIINYIISITAIYRLYCN